MGLFGWLFGTKKRRKRKPVKARRPQVGVQKKAAVAEKPLPSVEGSVDYFEVSRPDGDGICGESTCSCGGVVLPRGSGYLYISRDAVKFRRNARSLQEALAKEKRVRSQMSDMAESAAVIHGRTTAILMCERAAKKKSLNLEVAAADAKHWWETGMAPLRITPRVKKAKGAAAKGGADEPVAESVEVKVKPKGRKGSKGSTRKKS